MFESNGAPKVPGGPSPVQVPVRGMSGRLAVLVVVGALAVAVGSALLGGGADRPSASSAAPEGPVAALTPNLTPRGTPMWSPSPLDSAPQAPPEAGTTPLADFAGALPGDDGNGPLPLGTVNDLPDADRLDFLFEFCTPGCYRDAHWMDPQNPKLGSGTWVAGRPFHVREGFINDRKEPLGEGFDVVLFVTRMSGGPDLHTYRYTSDFVLRGTSDRCGPTYRTQTAPRTCEWFVHDFPEGLPEGRFAIWAVWEAPCSAWIDFGLRGSCQDPDEVMSLFASGFDAPFGLTGPGYTEVSS